MAEVQPDKSKRDERVSLAGLDPEEALRALLKVDPEALPEPKDNEEPSDTPQ
jgi:hypothetical protein